MKKEGIFARFSFAAALMRMTEYRLPEVRHNGHHFGTSVDIARLVEIEPAATLRL